MKITTGLISMMQKFLLKTVIITVTTGKDAAEWTKIVEHAHSGARNVL